MAGKNGGGGQLEGPLAWLYRVKNDEQNVLFRASANYASKGYDPALAAKQRQAEQKAKEPDAMEVEAAVASKLKTKGRGSGIKKLVRAANRSFSA